MNKKEKIFRVITTTAGVWSFIGWVIFFGSLIKYGGRVLMMEPFKIILYSEFALAVCFTGWMIWRAYVAIEKLAQRKKTKK